MPVNVKTARLKTLFVVAENTVGIRCTGKLSPVIIGMAVCTITVQQSLRHKFTLMAAAAVRGLVFDHERKSCPAVVKFPQTPAIDGKG